MALTGVVKKYNSDKGFGFIVPAGTNQDLFVLRTDVIGGSLQAGDKVSFDEGFNDRTDKPKAINVTGGTGPQGKGDGEGGKGKGKRGDKGKGGAKQLPGLAGLNGGLAAGPISPCPLGPCGPMPGGPCGLPGKPMAMPGAVPGSGKTGLVKFFNDEKGFGFIKQDDGGTDLFVHRNDVIDQLLKEGDRVTYSEAVDSRTGRVKAHQVAGGSGGVKPPEKGKGKGKKGKGKSQGSPGIEAPGVPSLDPGSAMSAMSAMGGAKMSNLAAQFGCGGAQGVLMGKTGNFPCGDSPGCGDMASMGGCGGLCGCAGCGCGCQPCGACGCGNLPMGGCNPTGCPGGCGCGGGSCGMPGNLGASGCCGGCCGCGGCGCGGCGGSACGCGGCGACSGCGAMNQPTGAAAGNSAEFTQQLYQRLAANAGGGTSGFDEFGEYGGQGSQNLARAAAGACFANLAGSGGALTGQGQGMAGMTMGQDPAAVPGGCFGNTGAGGNTNLNAAVYERLAATAGGNFEDYAEYGGQGSGNLPRAGGAGGVAFANLGGSANMLPSVSGAGGNALLGGAGQGGMPNQMTMANMQAMAAQMNQPGVYQMGQPGGNVSHGNL